MKQSKLHQVLAALSKDEVEPLLKLLMISCAVFYKGSTTSELKTLARPLLKDAQSAALAMMSEITTYLAKIIQDGPEGVAKEDFLQQVRNLRAGVRQVLREDSKVSHETLDVLAATTAYLINFGEPALNKIRRLLPQFAEPVLNQSLIGETQSQSDFAKPLQKIVKSLTGRNGSMLTQEESLKLRDKNANLHKEYLRLRRGFNQVWKDEIQRMVFESKKPYIPYSDVLKSFDKQGIENPLPRGFSGMIDSNGKFYTTKGKLINGVPGLGFEVVMNKAYDPEKDDQYVFTTVDASGKISQYGYTVDYRKSANKQKFEVVEDLDAVIDDVHKKWLQILKKQDESLACVAALELEILYTFSARVGSAGNEAGGQSTYGISTLRVKHATINPGTVLLSYHGKDGVRQRHLIQANAGVEGKLMYNMLRKLCEGKKPGDFIFTYDKNGRQKHCHGGYVNALFRKLGATVTVHKLRHVRGTALFKELLKKHEDKIFKRTKPVTQVEADKMIKALATQVGKLLGHVRGVGATQKATGATALGAYISPSVILEFYSRLGLRVPRFLSKVSASTIGHELYEQDGPWVKRAPETANEVPFTTAVIWTMSYNASSLLDTPGRNQFNRDNAATQLDYMLTFCTDQHLMERFKLHYPEYVKELKAFLKLDVLERYKMLLPHYKKDEL